MQAENVGIQDQLCSGARVAGSSEPWGPAVCPLSSGSFSRDRTRWVRAARPRSSPGTERRTTAEGNLPFPSLPAGKTLPAGKRTSAGTGHSEESGPAAEPGSSREPRRTEQRRARGPKAGVSGEGAQRFPPAVCAFNFQLSFIYSYLKGIQ